MRRRAERRAGISGGDRKDPLYCMDSKRAMDGPFEEIESISTELEYHHYMDNN